MSALRGHPKAVYAVGFACLVAFMGIGLVDPILPVLAEDVRGRSSVTRAIATAAGDRALGHVLIVHQGTDRPLLEEAGAS